MSSLITVFVVLQVVIWPGASELGQVLLVVELQEVGPFAAETQEGRRQAARQGHEPPGAANAEGKTVTHKYILLLSAPFPPPNKTTLSMQNRVCAGSVFLGRVRVYG